MARETGQAAKRETLLDLFIAQGRRASHLLSIDTGPVQTHSDPLAGRINLVGPLGQHRTAEELRRGAPLPGVNVLLDGNDADVAPGKLRLDADAVLEVS